MLNGVKLSNMGSERLNQVYKTLHTSTLLMACALRLKMRYRNLTSLKTRTWLEAQAKECFHIFYSTNFEITRKSWYSDLMVHFHSPPTKTRRIQVELWRPLDRFPVLYGMHISPVQLLLCKNWKVLFIIQYLPYLIVCLLKLFQNELLKMMQL